MESTVEKLNGISASASGAAEPPPNAELLSSLRRLVRGLSLLFWCIPLALIICLQTAQGDWFRPLGIAPALIVTALLLQALASLGHFQAQERIWRLALDRARLLAIVNVGLSPFLYWANQLEHPFFTTMVHLMLLSSVLFLYSLNPVLWRLAAMLPDETLRLETRLFTNINRGLLLWIFALVLGYVAFRWINPHQQIVLPVPPLLLTAAMWGALFLGLLPIAMTMAITWKIKEVILASVFGPTQS